MSIFELFGTTVCAVVAVMLVCGLLAFVWALCVAAGGDE